MPRLFSPMSPGPQLLRFPISSMDSYLQNVSPEGGGLRLGQCREPF